MGVAGTAIVSRMGHRAGAAALVFYPGALVDPEAYVPMARAVADAGFPVVLLESFVPDEAIEVFRRHGVTMAGGSTAFYITFLNAQRKNPDEPLPPASIRPPSGPDSVTASTAAGTIELRGLRVGKVADLARDHLGLGRAGVGRREHA